MARQSEVRLAAHHDGQAGRLGGHQGDEIGGIIMPVQPNHVIAARAQLVPDLRRDERPEPSRLARTRSVAEKH